MLILGIDDSGRGPVIGPMIMAGVLIDKELEKKFKEQGIKDSKLLTPRKREILAEIIKKKALSFRILTITPREIDGRSNAGINLNKVEALKAGEIINKINKSAASIDKIKIIVDCPSPNIPKWRAVLKSYVENTSNLNFLIEHKADRNHIAVSAASIIAKSKREKEIKKIKKSIGVDFGSGYPSDPITRKFLSQYAKKHKTDGIFRQTWSTWKNHIKKKEQKKLGEFKK